MRKPKTTQRSGNRAPVKRGRPAAISHDDIVQAAKMAFSKSGYANVTLETLAEDLKVRKGTVHYHANKKINLLIAISSQTVEACYSDLQSIASVQASPETRLVLAIRSLMSAILNDQPASKIYYENEADLPDKFRIRLRKRLRTIQDIFVKIIEEGVANGHFEGDPDIIAKHVLSVCAWPYRWFSPTGKLSLDQFINTAVNFILRGVLSRNQTPSSKPFPRS